TRPLCAHPFPGDTASGRTSLCAVQRTPGHGIGAMAGGGPFTRTPEAETYVLSPQQAPVPPRPHRHAGFAEGGTERSMARTWQDGNMSKDYFPMILCRSLK